MPMPIIVPITDGLLSRNTPTGISGLVDWPTQSGATTGGEAVRNGGDPFIWTQSDPAGIRPDQRQSVSFRDDDFSYFTGMDETTVLRWFQVDGMGPPPSTVWGGPSFWVTVSNGGTADLVELGICNQSLNDETPLIVETWVSSGPLLIPSYINSDGAGAPGNPFASINPVTGAFWTIRDLIYEPTNVPIGPGTWIQPTIFYIIEIVQDAYVSTFWRLCAGQTIWFLPEIDSIDVNEGPTAGGTTVVISGTSLFFSAYSPEDIQVYFGTTLGTNVSIVWDPTVHLFTVTSPAHVAGYVDITVRCWYPDGGFEDAILPLSYLYTDGGPPPPTPDIIITGSGGVEFGQDPNQATIIVLSADVSGLYTLVPDKRNDTVYTRNVDPDDTTDVAIPTPFGKTGYFGG